MPKSIGHISIFGEYQKREDRITAALLHVINVGGTCVIQRLFGGMFDFPSNQVSIITQSHQGQSIPDGEISCNCHFSIYIESKITTNAINQEQLNNHLSLQNPANNQYLCYITPDEVIPTALTNLPLGWLNWKDVVKILIGFIADGLADKLLQYLIEQFIILVKHLVYKIPELDMDIYSENFGSLSKEQRVIIVGGSWGENIALKHRFYACQAERYFRPSKYLAFYHQGRIKYVFEILQEKDNIDLRNCDINQSYFLQDETNYSGSLRKYMKLKLVHTCSPEIKNDKKDKNGNPCAFTQGQTYSTYEKITNVSFTSQL